MKSSSDGILQSMEMMLAHLKVEIIDEGKNEAKQIQQAAQTHLEEMKSKDLHHKKKELILIQVHQRIRERTNQWIKNFNSLRENLIEKTIADRLGSLIDVKDTNSFPDLIKDLYSELEPYLEGHSALIHVTKGSRKHISEIPSNCDVKADLDEIGIKIEFLDHAIIIENTLESRLSLIKHEIESLINKEIFSGLEDPPWLESQILDILMRESMV